MDHGHQLVFLTLFAALLYSGCIFGWSPMKTILQDEGVLWPAGDQIEYTEGNVTRTGECPPFTPSFNSSVLITMCAAHHSKNLDLIYVCGSFMQSGGGIVVGALLDALGPRTTVVIAGVANITGFLIFGFFDQQIALIIAYMLMAFGGMCIFLGGFLTADFWPERKNAVLAGISCLFDASAVIFVVFKLVYGLGVSRRVLFSVFAAITVLFTALLFAAWSRATRKSDTLLTVAPPDNTPRSPFTPSTPSQKLSGSFTRSMSAVSLGDAESSHPKSVGEAMCSFQYVFIIVFCIIHMTRSNVFLGQFSDMYKALAVHDGDENIYVMATEIIVPLGCLLVVPIEKAINGLGLTLSGDLINLLGAIYSGLYLSGIMWLQPVTAVIYTSYRAFVFSMMAAYNFNVFGPKVVGRTTGMMYTIGSLVQPIQYWGVSMSQQGATLNYRWPWNTGLLAALLVMVVMGQLLRRFATSPTLVISDKSPAAGGCISFSESPTHSLGA